MSDKVKWVETREEFLRTNLTCKLCKRDMTQFGLAFNTVYELKDAHTLAHLKDLVRDMQKVCTCAAKNGWVDRNEASSSEDILLRAELIEGGLF